MQIAHGHPNLFQGAVSFSIIHLMDRKPWLPPFQPPRAFQHLIEPYERLWWTCFDRALGKLAETDRRIVLEQVTGARPTSLDQDENRAIGLDHDAGALPT